MAFICGSLCVLCDRRRTGSPVVSSYCPPDIGFLPYSCFFAATPSAHAGDWADRASQLNRKEITAGEAAQQNKSSEQDRRNKVCVRRIRPAEADVDWNADPTAVPYMLYQINKRTNLPVFINNEGLDVSKDEIFEHTVLYLTSHRRWTFNEKETAKLHLFLTRGGTLWLDDCYSRAALLFRQRAARGFQDDPRL